MKINAGFVFVLFFALARARHTYDEKDDAIKAVQKKQAEVESQVHKINKDIENERLKINGSIVDEYKEFGSDKNKEVYENFSEEILKTIRQAIEKGKPLSCIDNIIKVAAEGRQQISETTQEYFKNLDTLVKSIELNINLSELETSLLQDALNVTVGDTIKKINDNKGPGLETLKKEGIKKCETVLSQLNGISQRITQISAKSEFLKAKNLMTKKFNELSDALNKKLQKCVG